MKSKIILFIAFLFMFSSTAIADRIVWQRDPTTRLGYRRVWVIERPVTECYGPHLYNHKQQYSIPYGATYYRRRVYIVPRVRNFSLSINGVRIMGIR